MRVQMVLINGLKKQFKSVSIASPVLLGALGLLIIESSLDNASTYINQQLDGKILLFGEVHAQTRSASRE